MTAPQASRSAARTVLALLVVSLMTFFLFSTDPSATGIAQEPSGTPTSSPTSFEINFINPSGSGHSEAMSTMDDTSGGADDTRYHLVAWINAVPSDHRVEFKYKIDGENEEKLIAVADQVNPGDTFEHHWAIPDEIPEYNSNSGTTGFTLYAILYSGATEIARDTESDIQKNDTSPPSPSHPEDDQARGSTIEIIDPVNGGPFPLFKPRDRNTFGVLFTKRSGNHSQIRYTVSPPGSEPEWTACQIGTGTQDTEPRCDISPDHDYDEITAVGATGFTRTCAGVCANQGGQTGDAHRVIPYLQQPTTITVTPDRQNELPSDACSADITALVKDQFGHTVAAAPIDIHAQGPSDSLFFSDASGNAPQLSHGKEEARTCADSPPSQSADVFQGDHHDPAGLDIKHSESEVATGDLGTYAFALYSPDRGETQATVWVDVDEDDQFCSAEVSATASVGWQVPAPDPMPLPTEESVCPLPTPSPRPSRSPTATPSSSPTTDPRGCTVFGTEAGETLTGTEGDDVICGFGGDDIIRSLGGNDSVYGDSGADEIRSGGGNDYAEGGGGKDTIRTTGGNDRANGGGQNDVMTGDGGRDHLVGGNGFDTIRGGVGNDVLDGRSGDDTLRGGAGRDRLFGRGGRDILHGDAGRDRCRGGPGKDRQRSC